MRGLKPYITNSEIVGFLSHPLWVRGLKQLTYDNDYFTSASHPLWVRGLKLVVSTIMPIIDYVAPLVGAWIET